MHIGIIPDGGRRWAELMGEDLAVSYQRTFALLLDVVSYFFESGWDAISLYLLSRRNLERTSAELSPLIRAEGHFCANLMRVLSTFDARVTVAGVRDDIPHALAEPVYRLVEGSASGRRRRLYLCIAYDPIEEIREASPGGHFDFGKLSVPEPLDLVIRTSGVKSLSDFLPLQSSYAQIEFEPKLFNEVTISDMERIAREYRSRPLRHGL